ncbi:MAG: hypothetical protein JWO56_3671 [Acidobacteria bacterium]|nr:hypothetical protein [Acidobacteriota bacterium]
MFRKAILLAALLLTAVPLFATDDCRDYRAMGALYEVRNLMLKQYSSSYDVDRFIDRRIEELREPNGEGGYRWVRWVRLEGDAPIDKHGHTVGPSLGAQPDHFEAAGAHAFAVRIAVPRKRSLLNGNNMVAIGKVEIRYTANGKTKTISENWDTQMNPDNSRTIDLPVIADHVDVAVEARASKPGESLVEVHFKQAAAQDDPANPDYATIVALNKVRSSSDARTVDYEIAQLERELFPGSESLPLLGIVADLRRADELMRSKKDSDVENGTRLLKETLRRLH